MCPALRCPGPARLRTELNLGVRWGLLNHWSANEVVHTGKVTRARSHTGACQSRKLPAGVKWESQERKQVVYDTAETQGIEGTCQSQDAQPGSSGIGRSASEGASLSVFSSVEPAYGSSPFSSGAGGCLCSLCLATLDDQELWRVNTQGADPHSKVRPTYPFNPTYLLSSSSVSPESSAPLSHPSASSNPVNRLVSGDIW